MSDNRERMMSAAPDVYSLHVDREVELEKLPRDVAHLLPTPSKTVVRLDAACGSLELQLTPSIPALDTYGSRSAAAHHYGRILRWLAAGLDSGEISL